MDNAQQYQTLATPVSSLFKDRGSKFLCFAFPVSTLEEIKQRLKELRDEHPKAVHHCYAYRLGFDKNNFRAQDDGEPSGSAGRPILGQIDSAGITNVLVVVVRYFGGTLLGVPGLIHAYKTATAEALREAVKVERWITKPCTLEFDYQKMGEVLYFLQKHEAQISRQDLQLFCTIEAAIPLPHYPNFQQKIATLQGVKMIVP